MLGAEVDIVGHYVAAGSIDDAFCFALKLEATPRTQVSVIQSLQSSTDCLSGFRAPRANRSCARNRVTLMHWASDVAK